MRDCFNPAFLSILLFAGAWGGCQTSPSSQVYEEEAREWEPTESIPTNLTAEQSGLGVQCATDEDCFGGGSSPCIVSTCDQTKSLCIRTNLPINTPCDDNDPCTDSDQCGPKGCVGTPLDCPPDEPCAFWRCGGDEGCLQSLREGDCEDDNLCTLNAACVEGTCTPLSSVICDDEESCTVDECAPSSGLCTHEAVTGSCDDGDSCTSEDRCESGACVGVPLQCEDNNPCTTDTCNPSNAACIHTIKSGECDDGNPCTNNGNCEGGFCESFPVECNDFNPCTIDSCSIVDGGCSHTFERGACDDNNVCTEGDICVVGHCVGSALDCEDGNSCTGSLCDASIGCLYSSLNEQTCNDGDPCTLSDSCNEGTCVGVLLSCDDGSPCNGVETCQGGNCIGGLPACGDGILEPLCGETCDDGNALGGDGCSEICSEETTGCTSNLQCGLATPCVTPLCDTASGECILVNTEGACDDGNSCTEGEMCTNGLCMGGNQVSCEDGIPCTKDTCTQSGCTHSPDDADCPGSGPCLKGICSSEFGCGFSALPEIPCDDGNPCTTNESCQDGTCEGTPLVCDTEEVCWAAFCSTDEGCVLEPSSGTACDDGDPCTLSDTCDEGTCLGTIDTTLENCSPPLIPYCVGPQSANEEWVCEMAIARDGQNAPPATGIQFAMQYNPFELELLGLFDELCYEGIGCFDVSVVGAGAFPLSSGHAVTMAPLSISSWQPKACDENNPCLEGPCENSLCSDSGGFGGFVIVHTSLPDTPLSEAYLDGEGNLQGVPAFATMRFKVLKSLEEPPLVYLLDPVAAGPGGGGLPVQLSTSLLLSSPSE